MITYTELTSYGLEHYEEVKDVKDCNKVFRTYNDKYNKGNDSFIKALQIFKILIGTDDKLVVPMELTDEVFNTQFYYKVDDGKHYSIMGKCRLDEYVEKIKTNMKYSLVLKTSPLKKTHTTSTLDLQW